MSDEGRMHPAQIDPAGANADDVLAWNGTEWVPVPPSGGTTEQKDLLDNNTDFVVVGDKTVDRVVLIEYSFQLPIGGREMNGKVTLLHEGATAEIINEYSFISPEIAGVTFGAAISGNDLRLTVVTSGIGENPKLVYRRFTLGFAT